MDNNLSGSKFRILNELLYVNDSKEAVDHFKNNPEDFDIVLHLFLVSYWFLIPN